MGAAVEAESGLGGAFMTVDDYWRFRLAVRRVRARSVFLEHATVYDGVLGVS